MKTFSKKCENTHLQGMKNYKTRTYTARTIGETTSTDSSDRGGCAANRQSEGLCIPESCPNEAYFPNIYDYTCKECYTSKCGILKQWHHQQSIMQGC